MKAFLLRGMMVVFLLLGMASCGQTGKLYLPEKNASIKN